MRTKNSNTITKSESYHMLRVKELPCSVCDHMGGCEAHHIKQGNHFTVIALCPDCHRGSINGLHGQRNMWRLKKMDEWDALNVTIKRLLEAA